MTLHPLTPVKRACGHTKPSCVRTEATPVLHLRKSLLKHHVFRQDLQSTGPEHWFRVSGSGSDHCRTNIGLWSCNGGESKNKHLRILVAKTMRHPTVIREDPMHCTLH